MFPASRLSFTVCICIAAIVGSVGYVAADPVIWTGPDISFSKSAGADPKLAANQDRITDGVWITRDTVQGIFNASPDAGDCSPTFGCFYTHHASPADTLWANNLTSTPGEPITATNWNNLSFESWEDAYGSRNGLQFNIVGTNAVVHLVSEDIYLNLTFTDWGGGGSGGSFSYTRSTAAAPTPTGDYNGNGIVDAADFTVWRDTLGQPAPSGNGSGADGNANGTIDTGDYDFWKMNFGNLAPGAGSGAATAVPEPTSIVLLICGIAAACIVSAKSTRRKWTNADWHPA